MHHRTIITFHRDMNNGKNEIHLAPITTPILNAPRVTSQPLSRYQPFSVILTDSTCDTVVMQRNAKKKAREAKTPKKIITLGHKLKIVTVPSTLTVKMGT